MIAEEPSTERMPVDRYPSAVARTNVVYATDGVPLYNADLGNGSSVLAGWLS